MKKIIWILLAVLLLSGCDRLPVKLGHTHKPEYAPGSGWERDEERHWYACRCALEMEAGVHTFDGDGICTLCQSHVERDGDTVTITNTNDQGDLTRLTRIGKEGIIQDEASEYTYDTDGTMILRKAYNRGSLTAEESFSRSDSGEIYRSGRKTTHTEGNAVLTDEICYDVYGNEIVNRSLNADGALLWELESEYAQKDNGEFYCIGTVSTLPGAGTTTVSTFNTYGNVLTRCKKNADGKVLEDLRWEYEYDEAGNLLYQGEYSGDTLKCETRWNFFESADMQVFYVHIVTTYRDDGTIEVKEFNRFEELVSTTVYDGEGDVIN